MRPGLSPLLLAALLAGCVHEPSTGYRFAFSDAEFRLSNAVDGGWAQVVPLHVPNGTSVITLRSAVEANEGLSYVLRRPDRVSAGGMSFPDAVDQPRMEWRSARNPPAGAWSLELACSAQCEYAFGIDLRDRMRARSPEFAERYEDLPQHFSGRSPGSIVREEQFHVPGGWTGLVLRVSAHAEKTFAYTLEDPWSETRSSMKFHEGAHIDGLKFVAAEAPMDGTWSLRIVCSEGCDYSFALEGS